MENLNLIDDSESGNTNAGFDNPPPYQPPYPSPVNGECFTLQPGKTPKQDGGYPTQPGNDPQHHGDYQPQPRNNPHQHDNNAKSPVYPQQYGGYPQQPGGYPPHPGGYPHHGGYPPQPGGYGQPGNDQQGYPQGQYAQQQQTVIVTQPMEQSVVIGQSRPRNYLIPAIFACLFCCLPFGLGAIHYATKANALADEGNLTEARIAAQDALGMIITSVFMGLSVSVVSFLYYFFSHQ